MTARNSPKKSETLEIRIPFPAKAALMEKARAEGRGASEIVRQQIDLYLQATPPVAAGTLPTPFKSLGLLLIGAASALAITLAASPATALPDPQAAFAMLDLNRDGLISPTEFATAGAFARLDRDGDGVLSPDEF